MTSRPTPICFWTFNTGREAKNGQPYIDPKLQEGTTPLVKQMAGRYTRSFRNYHHPRITPRDYSGARAILDNQFKLVVHERGNKVVKELFDVRRDPAETNNLIQSMPRTALQLAQQLRAWQKSVLRSLTGADYQQ